MANYKPDLSYQSKFITIDFSQQIVPGTFEYALSHIVDNHLDLSGFDEWFSNDKGGAAAYPPSVMLKVILFAYSRGMITSRRIANACETNITFMSLSGDVQPHYTCIAFFVARMSTAKTMHEKATKSNGQTSAVSSITKNHQLQR